MRVPRSFVGKEVRVEWADTQISRIESTDPSHADVPKGRAALARYWEWGVVDDVSEGVVRMYHSLGKTSGITGESEETLYYSWILEDNIEKIVELEPKDRPAAIGGQVVQ